MDGNNVPRRSDRVNKGVPPSRYGLENYEPECAIGGINVTPHPIVQNQPDNGAYGSTGNRNESTLVRIDSNLQPNYAKSVASKGHSKASRRSSVREVEHLKRVMEQEDEFHAIEMLELRKRKEFLLRKQQRQNELKHQEDILSNIDDADDVADITELEQEQRNNNVNDWVDKIDPCQFQNTNHPQYFESTRQNPQYFESTRQNQHEHSAQSEILIAAFRALQSKDIKALPTFSGEVVLEWPNFISEFRRSTLEFNISQNKNLRRLDKALTGPARSSVQTLLTSPDNIEQIISHLEMSFGRREWILEHLVHELRNLPTMKEENVHQFQLYHSKLFGAVTTIKNMKANSYLDTPELLKSLEEKLPPTTRNFWIHYKAELMRRQENVNIEALGGWFKFELDAQYAGLSAKDIVKKTNNGKATVLTVGVNSNSSSKREKWCSKCKGAVGHYIQDCSEFKNMAIDKRREFAKQNNLCFMCLIKGHQAGDCRKKNSLPKCSKCNKEHASILHPENTETANAQVGCVKTCDITETAIAQVGCTKTSDVLLKIAMVTIKGPMKTRIVPAFFDEGSTATMMDEDLANDLGLEGLVSPITYRWTNDIVRTDSESRIVNINVSSTNRISKFYELNNVRTGKNLALPSQAFNVKEVLKLHPYLNEEKLQSISNVQPLLLIGSNNGGFIVSIKTVQRQLNGLIECKSRLGWTIHGPIHKNSVAPPSMSVHICANIGEEENLNDLVKKSYEIENFGITNETETLSEADAIALDIMRDTMKKVGDRFEIGHLYKNPDQKFPTEESKQMALKRLHSIEKKMDQDEKFADEYIQRVEDYVKKGYIEKLTGDDLKDTPKTYYLPHFDAHNPNKPGKFRWVMDAKAKAGEYSLNDLLLQGPDFVPSLLGVLWRARLKLIGINSDIAEMFHQVEIRPEDRDSQRFFFRGKDRNRPPDVYRMRVMMFGAVSSPSCAQFVKNENAKSFEKIFPGVERAIVKQHYVDDYVDSTDTVEEAITLASNVTSVHKKGGFRLVKWISNSEEFMRSIPEEMRLPDHDKLSQVRMLGVDWNFKNDELVFKFEFKKFSRELLNGETIPTKRQMLRFLMSIFDPLGILSPLVVKLKILYQELWRLDIGWDEQVPGQIFEKWIIWLNEAKSIQQVRIPRCYFPVVCQYTNIQLHTFCDAGENAYCAMTFIRAEINGQAFVALIQAKNRVAPMKMLTIPRLEIQAAVTGSQLANTIEKELEIVINKRIFWVDSTLVLGWINTREKLGAFIGSRVSKILNCTKREEWSWIPTDINTADLATKTTNKVDLSQTSVWFNGPEFLRLPETEWPQFQPPTPEPEEVLMFIQELEPPEERITVNLEHQGNSLPDASRFSKYNRLVRATAYVLKMVKNVKLPKNDRPNELSLDVDDIHQAEMLWYRKVQFDCYAQELHDLKTKGYVKKSSCLYALSPFIDDNNLICMRGRIPGINPIILQQHHLFTKLLIQWYHEINLHQGVDTVVNHLRDKFWIPRCRTVIRQIFKSCMSCRVRKPKVKLVEMGDIPRERSERCEFPFTFSGLDYFGPMMVKYGRRYEKVWGALFTCLTTRGVHVELASSLTTNSTLMALTRFMNLRGVPRKVFSDNGLNFVGASNELRDFIQNLDHETIHNKLSIRGVEWKFNCPAAPNRGGAWERMVQSVKEGLDALLSTQFPSFEVLATAISEVVNTINNRPLTYVSSDADDFNIKAITPNDIILLRANHSQYDVKMEYNYRPKETWKLAHKIADDFWYRWVKEYRPTLIKRAKWPDNRDNPQLQVGDLVRIVDENEIRGRFPKGIITKVFPDKKGIVRTVEVDTIIGNTKRNYKRPISKIAKIDLSEGLENVIVKG